MRAGHTDPIYAYTPTQEHRLAQNLSAIYSDIDAKNYRGQSYSTKLFCEWHARLFHAVRDHAGRHRSPNFGPETLTFGPNRSTPRDSVPEELATHCANANRLINELLSRAAELDIHFVREAVRIAVYVHADLIRIHPFIDGNGRIGRLAMDWILLRLGFPNCVAFHVPAQEYRDVLNYYYAKRDIDPLVDLVLRALSFGLA